MRNDHALQVTTEWTSESVFEIILLTTRGDIIVGTVRSRQKTEGCLHWLTASI
jgi:hypothetical protein